MYESEKAKDMREMMDRLSEDPTDPFTKEVWPGSGGTYDIKSLQSMVARQLKELAETQDQETLEPSNPLSFEKIFDTEESLDIQPLSGNDLKAEPDFDEIQWLKQARIRL